MMASHIRNRLFSAALPVLMVVLASCHDVSSTSTPPSLPRGVRIFEAREMLAHCQIDPEGLCQEFATPPWRSVLTFENRLGEMLRVRGLKHLAPKMHDYVRQYWAVRRNNRVRIVGNFVCRSIADLRAEIGKDPDPRMPDSPVHVDDAGECQVVVQFWANDPLAIPNGN